MAYATAVRVFRGVIYRRNPEARPNKGGKGDSLGSLLWKLQKVSRAANDSPEAGRLIREVARVFSAPGSSWGLGEGICAHLIAQK